MDTTDILLQIFRFEAVTSDAYDTTDVKSYIKDDNETAEDFVQRLLPSKILRPRHADSIAVNSIRSTQGLEDFLKKGVGIIKSYEEKCRREKIKEQQMLLGEELKEKIISLAKEEKFLEGRWLLFQSQDVVDDVWLKIVRSTMAGQLGINARIDRKTCHYEIRVFTKDFTDEVDVCRVLRCLKDLQLLGDGIRYKCSAFSKLGISLGNVFKIAPSIYRSEDFDEKDDDTHSLYGTIGEDESVERFVARLQPSKVLQSMMETISLFKEKDDMEDYVNNWAVKVVGKMLLDRYKIQIENKRDPVRYCMTESLQKNLSVLAVICNCVTGRWTVYARDDVDSLWLKTVEGTVNGTLGINAEIQKFDDQYEISLITKDFNDEADVKRVLVEMKKLGFKPPFFYKTHLFSKLGLVSNNAYGLSPNFHEISTNGPRMLSGNVVEQPQSPPPGNLPGGPPLVDVLYRLDQGIDALQHLEEVYGPSQLRPSPLPPPLPMPVNSHEMCPRAIRLYHANRILREKTAKLHAKHRKSYRKLINLVSRMRTANRVILEVAANYGGGNAAA